MVFRCGPKDLAEHFGTGNQPERQCAPQTVGLAVQIAIGTLDALKNLHDVGYVHCDIKPKIILFDESKNAITIIDFGGAVEINGNGIERSWEYSAPEQWARAKCTRRTDAFAVVGILIYLLTGCAPFVAEGEAGYMEHCRQLCEEVCKETESSHRELFLDRTKHLHDIQHCCGVDGNHGLRHLLWMGMTRPLDTRWSCDKLKVELGNILKRPE